MKLQHPENFNIALAELVLDQVTTHPDRHDQCQEMWTEHKCAQVGCIMGWAAVFNGKWDGDSSPEDLGVTEGREFDDIFDESENDVAIVKLKDYITQARAAQALDVVKEFVLV